MNFTSTPSSSLFPNLGFGLGLRPDYYQEVLEGKPSASWFEVVSENFMEKGGRPLYTLQTVRKNHPIVLHGTTLSIGSTDPLNWDYLKRLKWLIQQVEPSIVSDHLCWTGVNGEYLHDLLPLPYTEEAVSHIVDRVDQVQNFLGRRILLENVSSYLTYSHSEMTEWEFISEISRRADCGLLLDVNNIYVSSVNHKFNPMDFINGVPKDRVGQIHLAGHSTEFTEDGRKYLIDTHDQPVCQEVWDLYQSAIEQLGKTNTMIERDANFPTYQELEDELQKAKIIEEKVIENSNISPNSRRDSELVPFSNHI